MLTKNLIKEVIVSNEDFILKGVGRINGRGVVVPESLRKTVILYGVRRSGKTFILYDLFLKNPGDALYIDFEDERLSGFDVADFERLREAFFELKPHLVGKPALFLLDEVQIVEGWERFCRRAVERERLRVVVSGSSSRIMPAEIQTELRGRAWGIEVLPYSYREFLRAKGMDDGDPRMLHGERRQLARSLFAEYLHWGGYPEMARLETVQERSQLVREYLSAMYFRDLVERYGMTNIPLFDTLMDRLFSAFSTRFSLSAFYRQYKDKFPMSKDLLFRYYRNFLQSMLVFEVRKLSESTYTRLRNPAKIYLVDTGLAKRLMSADEGRLLENIVYLHLRRTGHEVWYFEEKHECDFVARTEGGAFLPVQVCLEITDANRRRETAGIVEACRRLGVNRGLLLTADGGDDFVEEQISVQVAPVWTWLAAAS